MRKCDIIIPVYNAYDFVNKCIRSVLENTNFKYARLIVINDKSSDERILPLLEKFKKKYPSKIILINNKKNLGFVGTVNKGMKYSKNDVVLLNSDTEVPDGWLESLEKCAYSNKKIATVTPLSNNASLASVPKFNQNNILPDEYNLKEMATLAKKYSMHIYPEIPSGHGFCLYIKREALKKVGYFDEKTFGKGYGEENDFCFRCLKKGFCHVLCDDVYVLHKGAQSFLEKGDHGEILVKKYPGIMASVWLWYQRVGIREIGDNIALAMGTRKNKINVLIVNNEKIKEIENLRKYYNFHFLRQKRNYYYIHSYFEDTDVKLAFYEKPMTFFYKNRIKNSITYERMIKGIENDFGISVLVKEKLSSKKIQNNCKKYGKRKKLDFELLRKKMLEYDFAMKLLDINGSNEDEQNIFEKDKNRKIVRRIFLKIRYILLKK